MGQTATADHSHPESGRAAAIMPFAPEAAVLPHDPQLTRRHHVDLLRTASAVCRRGIAG